MLSNWPHCPITSTFLKFPKATYTEIMILTEMVWVSLMSMSCESSDGGFHLALHEPQAPKNLDQLHGPQHPKTWALWRLFSLVCVAWGPENITRGRTNMTGRWDVAQKQGCLSLVFSPTSRVIRDKQGQGETQYTVLSLLAFLGI